MEKKINWLAMIDNYPFAFLEYKKDLKQFELDSEERANVEWIPIKEGLIE
ncbi:MAG TPA: hypothetical protein VF680_17140 [Allosphingosinicella sp.]|jgi:hypothetical protein